MTLASNNQFKSSQAYLNRFTLYQKGDAQVSLVISDDKETDVLKVFKYIVKCHLKGEKITMVDFTAKNSEHKTKQ